MMFGVRRNCHVVVRDPGDFDGILESIAGRGLVALALFDLGQPRDSGQFLTRAVEPLIISATTIGIPH